MERKAAFLSKASYTGKLIKVQMITSLAATDRLMVKNPTSPPPKARTNSKPIIQENRAGMRLATHFLWSLHIKYKLIAV